MAEVHFCFLCFYYCCQPSTVVSFQEMRMVLHRIVELYNISKKINEMKHICVFSIHVSYPHMRQNRGPPAYLLPRDYNNKWYNIGYLYRMYSRTMLPNGGGLSGTRTGVSVWPPQLQTVRLGAQVKPNYRGENTCFDESSDDKTHYNGSTAGNSLIPLAFCVFIYRSVMLSGNPWLRGRTIPHRVQLYCVLMSCW